ncbi:hypothetical protein U6B65_04760 [Oscillospiraceae bacterium MB08-C2-2]|nr:hypothetical protein U6B65_04760 [Oscillospiraceae bacterium MB08-C2-2]
MPDYKQMYLKLFNKTTDAIQILIEAQLEAEAAFINSVEEETPAPVNDQKT